MFEDPVDLACGTAEEAEANVRAALSALGISDVVLNRTLYISHDRMEQADELMQTEEWSGVGKRGMDALSVEGQNSFQDYFREILAPVVRAYAEDVFDQEGEDTVFFINFFSDALIAAMLRWLSSRNCMPPDRFTRLLRQSVLGGAQILGGSPG